MRIESYNSLSMNHISSGKKMGNISLPDYNDFNFNTKTSSKMSDEKYEEAIVAQAKKDAAADKFGVECSGFKELMKSYVSVVSPDRKSIIENALSSLNNTGKIPELDLSQLDILLGKRTTTGDKITYAEFKDRSGEIVATYSNGGWSFESTKAEDSRTSDFYGIYRKAWNAAKNGNDNTTVSATEQNTFNVIA